MKKDLKWYQEREKTNNKTKKELKKTISFMMNTIVFCLLMVGNFLVFHTLAAANYIGNYENNYTLLLLFISGLNCAIFSFVYFNSFTTEIRGD